MFDVLRPIFIFLSLRGLLECIIAREVDEEDLLHGLYFFGFGGKTVAELLLKKGTVQRLARQLPREIDVNDHLHRAWIENRLGFRKHHNAVGYYELNDFLKLNRRVRIDVPTNNFFDYQIAKQLIEEANNIQHPGISPLVKVII